MHPPIPYNDYVIAFALFDTKWSSRKPGAGLPSSDCALEIRKGLKAHVDELTRDLNCRNNRNSLHSSSAGDTCAIQPDAFKGLFEPEFFVPLGMADLASIFLADDFESLQVVIGSFRNKLIDASICLCPSMSSIISGLSDDATGAFLVEPADVVCEREDASLLTFTKLKLDAIACLTSPLLFQQAIERRIARTCIEWRRVAIEAIKSGSAPDLTSLQITDECIRSTRIAIVEPQGLEEIGLLIRTSNLSVSASLIALIRQTLCSDLLDSNNRALTHAIDSTETWTQLFECSDNTTPSQKISDNHVFRWSTSLCTIELESFVLTTFSDDAIRGFVDASTFIQVPPGHCRTAIELIEPSIQPVLQSDLESLEHLVVLGRADIQISHARGSILSSKCLIPLTSLIERLRSILTSTLPTRAGRDVVNMSTTVGAPTACFGLLRPRLVGHTGKFVTVLPKLGEHLFDRFEPGHFLAKNYPNLLHGDVSLDLQTLRWSMREDCVPSDLQRAVEQVFCEFRVCLEDPDLFDAVLDLYDAFSAFHMALAPRSDLAGAREPYSPQELSEIATMVQALSSAIDHRVADSSVDRAARDASVDFRGRLNQILHAISTPLMCGLGLPRKYLLRWGSTSDLAAEAKPVSGVSSRPALGAIASLVRVSLQPGISVTRMSFAMKRGVSLSLIDADVSHVLFPPSYADYIHESGHLWLHAVLDRDSGIPMRSDVSVITAQLNRLDELRDENLSEALAGQVEPPAQLVGDLNNDFEKEAAELFALAVEFIFGFQLREADFLVYRLIALQKHQPQQMTTEPLAQLLAETLGRYFAVTTVFSHASQLAPAAAMKHLLEYGVSDGPIAKAEATLDRFLQQHSLLFPGDPADWTRAGGRWREYLFGIFREMQPIRTKVLAALWDVCLPVLEGYYRDAFVVRPLPAGSRMKDASTLNDGCPLSRTREIISLIEREISCELTPAESKYLGELKAFQARRLPRGATGRHTIECDWCAPDMLGITATVIAEYCSGLGTRLSERFHFDGDSRHTLSWESSVSEVPWGHFQLRPGSASLYSVDPAARRSRMRTEVAMLKSFWDCAGSLRLRRLKAMIGSHADSGAK